MEASGSQSVAAQVTGEHSYSTFQFKPLFLQRLERNLDINILVRETENLLQHADSSEDELCAKEKQLLANYKPRTNTKQKGEKVKNGVIVTPHERRLTRDSLYCTSHLKYKRKWLRDLLLSDSSSGDSSDSEPELPAPTVRTPSRHAAPALPTSHHADSRLRHMLREHTRLRKMKEGYLSVTDRSEYKDYSMGVLGQGPIEIIPLTEKLEKKLSKKLQLSSTSSTNTKSKASSTTSPADKKPSKEGKVKKKKDGSKSHRRDKHNHDNTVSSTPSACVKPEDVEDGEIVVPPGYSDLEEFYSLNAPRSPSTPSHSKHSKSGKKKPSSEALIARRKRLWHNIVKKDIPKAAKARLSLKKEKISNAKKCVQAVMKQKRKEAISSQRSSATLQNRMRRVSKEVLLYWKRFERVEKQQLKKVQKEAQEQRRADLNMLEQKRQTRKLNFLITQTELYAHFMAKKIEGEEGEVDESAILGRLDEEIPDTTNAAPRLLSDIQDNYSVEEVKNKVLDNVTLAYNKQNSKTAKFDCSVRQQINGNLGLSQVEPAAEEFPQPLIFQGTLKSYQIKGMNWLANLYSQGINGILADEMGLGKTVQTIAFLAHLAEVHGIWGPFLVIAPSSTLHNWQQECARFLPKMKVVPYWGTTEMRKTLRKFWDQTHLHTEKSSFHIVITSYQLVIQDAKFFQKINWHYLVFDEAQALKSSGSARWRILLGFNCRNRLLLTGTPIQNSMAELWALLHFIMPTLFDSHDEFNEWFSKDIESTVEGKSNIDQNHLSRLHMILKPFMLRRIKRDVENDLNEKIEILVYCPLTIRQRYLYDAIKRKIRIEDLLQSAAGVSNAASASAASNSTASSLMNLVMQFRKVCNHPELFERRDIKSPAFVPIDPFLLPKLVYREGLLDQSLPSRRHLTHNLLYVHAPHNIQESLSATLPAVSATPPPVGRVPSGSHGRKRGRAAATPVVAAVSPPPLVSSLFSFLPFVSLSPVDIYRSMLYGIVELLKLARSQYLEKQKIQHARTYQSKHLGSLSRRRLIIYEDVHDHRANSTVLDSLLFTSYTSTSLSHLTHNHYYMRETLAHRKTRIKHSTGQVLSPVKKKHKMPKSLAVSLPDDDDGDTVRELGKYHVEDHRLISSHDLLLSPSPNFLLHTFDTLPKAYCPPISWYCSDRSAETSRLSDGFSALRYALQFGVATLNNKRSGSTRIGSMRLSDANSWRYDEPSGLRAVNPPHGFSKLHIPDKRSMIVDAGKMHVLDELLNKLKKEGHRVLIYSTMTKVIDLLEEFMWYRKHQYKRLDGSSKIADRRDMVSDFQSKSDIFVFLLSTRAGGLGINLTAADTVIFYDSDWNPTVDAQAMDRAHRLGQTKQVTVYRLVCKGTIEERILERAREKSEIQRMVISGHNEFKPDVLKPKEVVSLLIDDESIKVKLQRAHEEKLEKQEKRKLDREDRRAAVAAKRARSGRKPRAAADADIVENNVTIAALSPSASEVSLNNVLKPGHTSSASLFDSILPAEDSIDGESVRTGVSSSRASSPGAVASCPSTPSLSQIATPPKKPRGRPKGYKPAGRASGGASGGSTTRIRVSGAPRSGGLKKALNAAEIAGARAGMTAAYAQYGYAVNTGTTGTPNATSGATNKS